MLAPASAANLPDRTRGYNIDADHGGSDEVDAKKIRHRIVGMTRPRSSFACPPMERRLGTSPWNITMIHALPCHYSVAMLCLWNKEEDVAVMAELMGA
jgi:hypothetical protein